MRLMTFQDSGGDRLGALVDGDTVVVDLAAAAGPNRPAFASMQALIDAGERGLAEARKLVADHPEHTRRPAGSVTWRSPLPRPVRLRDCGLFIEHLAPTGKSMAKRQAASADDPEAELARLLASGRYDVPKLVTERVLYYGADHLSVSGPDEVINCPSYSAHLDYELEWAAVVGRTGRDITPDDAHSYIFGYTIFNDWTARDTQALIAQAGFGVGGDSKDFDGSTTLGPCIVTADEIADPYALEMSAWVNGVERSRGTTRRMHHSFESAVVQLSTGKTVYAGEVLGSGTVRSGTSFENGWQLADGDVVELEVEGIGVLRNRVQIPGR
ncbi:fumarylacetoacetase [Streptomyces libani subsp. rufus]|nr:fumarylacetoacetase [Streptomyces libani subsp. rufus]